MESISPNLKIVECNEKSNYCLIAFSSNGPNVEQRFEFEHICNSRRIKRFFKKIIFLRDPKRVFYIEGIDKIYDSVDKVMELLRTLTKGMKVYVIGYSSGGYMTIISSFLLNDVERAICLGAIVNILDWHGSHCDLDFAETEVVIGSNANQKKYFNLFPLLKKAKNNLLFFYAGKAESDIRIVNNVKKLLFYKQLVVYSTSKHGDYCLPFDYKYLLTYPGEKIKTIFVKFYNKMVSPTRFSIALQGPLKFSGNYCLKWARGIIRRIGVFK